MKSKEEMVAETKAKLQRAVSRDGGMVAAARKEVGTCDIQSWDSNRQYRPSNI